MSGVTNVVFRRLMLGYGADLVFTEMLNDRGVVSGTKRSVEMLYIAEDECNVGVQLFGREPEIMAEAAKIAVSKGAILIDINLGCPVPKVVRKKKGAYLLKEPERVYEIVSAIKKRVSVPVTAKIRKGWYADGEDGMRVVAALRDAGVDAITVHARSVRGGYAEEVDLAFLKRVKETLDIPVVGNGGVMSVEDAAEMIEASGCDGVMLARGVLGNPWLVEDIKRFLNGDPPREISKEEFFSVLRGFLHDYIGFKGQEKAFRETKKFISWFIRDLPGASKIRDGINRAGSWAEVWYIIDRYENVINYRFLRGRRKEWKKASS